jgi:hypothetical protein
MLRIYNTASPGASYSTDGEMSNPLRHGFDGRTGGVVEQLLYVRNDDPFVTYSGIQVTAVDTGSDKNVVDGTDGYAWKLKAGSTQPIEEEWNSINEGNTILLSGQITDTSTYLPFWLRIEIPAGAPVESIDDVQLQIDYHEFTV